MSFSNTVIFGGLALALAACGSLVDVVGQSEPQESAPSEVEPAAVTEEPTAIPAPTVTPTPLPQITVDSYYPNEETPLDELVILRGEDRLFDPAAEVSGGSGELSFVWDFDQDGAIDSSEMDPAALLLEPGEYFPVLTVRDEAGQVLSVELPKVVKIGDPVEPDWQFGVAAHVNFSHGLYNSLAEMERALDLIAEAGIEAIRVDFSWEVIERQGDYRYSWKDFDLIVDEAEERDLKVVAILDYSPRWASSAPTSPTFWTYPPKNPEKFGEFAREAVARYGDRVDTWEIWNEPNMDLFFKGSDPLEYFPLLREAYVAAKYEDPDVRVIIGGLANGPSVTNLPGTEPDEFIATLYDAGAGLYSDGAALHPYTDPHLGLGTLLTRVRSVRTAMDEHGGEKHILWIGELGYPTGFQYWSEPLLANWLTRSFTALLDMEGIGPLIWYNFRDKGTDPNDGEHHFGLVERDFETKLTYEAYKEFIENFGQ